MLQQEEIEAILAHTVDVRLARENEAEKNKLLSPYDYKAEYYPNHNYMVKLYYTVRIHFDNRIIPHELYQNRAPNQTQKEADWLAKNYKMITGPVAMDYVNTAGRCFIQGNFDISYHEEHPDLKLTNNTYEEYMNSEFGQYGSAMNYARNFLPTIKAQDSNGVIAIRPKEIPLTVNEEGETVVSAVDLPEPLPYYYDIHRLVGYVDGVYALIETPEKSIVEVDSKPQRTGFVYELYDDTWIYRIVQEGEKSDNNYQIIRWFEHKSGEIPAQKLMGVAGIDDNQIIYQSPMMLATALLEEALLDNGYLQMIKAKVVFPHMIVLASQCEYEETTDHYTATCQEGTLKGTYSEGGNYARVCPKCNGQGLVSRMAPFGEMMVRPPDQFDPEGDKAIQDPIKFVSPPLDSPEMLRKEVELNITKARGILHLNTTTGEAKGQENATATAKALDLKNLVSFVAPISAQTWEIVRFIYRLCGKMRYGDRFNMPDITEPKEFDFKSQSDFLDDIAAASESGAVPYPIISELLRQYIKSAFHGENSSVKILNLLTSADRLLTVSQEAIDMGVTRDEIANWEVILHQSGMSFIAELITEDEGFLELPQVEQVAALRQKAMDVAEAIKETKRQELLDSVNKDGISDVEAESRAKLKGTVGGVEGIIGVNKSVHEGIMSEAAAEEILIKVYGFEPNEAARMVEQGTTQEIEKRAAAALSEVEE
ncbi:hypothetical protein DRO66_00290 [Candidatus Bathyarchaeota archaeon]|nr:MAG: hypothetical protein DRO66_00290 [Candidatus Bathyarchaeota archaeon]